ncbi:MAG: ImmA/IrrE family metallo-endopeptidase [Gammaproteobacteria bacterium]|nr:MAG: ImmA/IrrE family metallo-endopeptidase [Gammaproteobacteria bacterium]
MSDEFAPAIFINGDDTKYANIFTLAHELSHIWLGESGISDADISSRNINETRCNTIAAEVLVPSKDFMHQWGNTSADFREKISVLNKSFKVSELVIARIALTNGKISQDNYRTVYAEVIKRWREKKRKDKEKESIVPFAITLPIRNSSRITNTVIELGPVNTI